MIVACCLFKYFPYGGLQRDFLRISQTLESQGHHIRVYVQQWQGPRPDSFEIIEVPVSSMSNHGKAKQFHAYVQQHLSQHPANVVVGFNKMPDLDVYYAADVCYEEKVSKEKKGLKSILYRMTSRYKQFAQFEMKTFAKGLNTRLLMIAQDQIEPFQRYYHTEKERFYLLPPGIAPDRKYTNVPEGTRKRIREKENLQPDDLLLLQVGSDFKRKGVDRTIRAIAAQSPLVKQHIVFIAVGQDDRTPFMALAKELGVEKNVRIFSGRDDVPALMAASDVFLHPAYSENTGTVILEAVAAGLPVIVTKACGYASYIEQANCGIVVQSPFNQQQLNAALEKLLTDKKYREQCAFESRLCADTQDLYSMPQRAAEIITQALHF